jgi:hypothetical protein
MAEYAADNVVYVIAIRSAGPKNGQEVRAALEAIRLLADPVCSPQVVAHRIDEVYANHHEALRTLGFDFEAANSIYPVVTEEAVA